MDPETLLILPTMSNHIEEGRRWRERKTTDEPLLKIKRGKREAAVGRAVACSPSRRRKKTREKKPAYNNIREVNGKVQGEKTFPGLSTRKNKEEGPRTARMELGVKRVSPSRGSEASRFCQDQTDI